MSQLGQAHSSTILSNPQHDSGKCGCYLPPQWKLRLGLSVHIMEKAAPFSLGKTFFRHFLIHSIGPWSGVSGACSVIFHTHQGHSYAPQVSVASGRANENETNNQTALGPKRMKTGPGNGFRSTLTSLESKCHSGKERKHSPGGAFHSDGGCFCRVGGEEDAAQLPWRTIIWNDSSPLPGKLLVLRKH